MLSRNRVLNPTLLAFFVAIGLTACIAEVPEEDGDELENVDEVGLAASIDYNIGTNIGSPVWQGTTCNMVNDYTPSCTGGSAHDAALYWSAPSSGTYTFTTAGSAFDTVLHVYNGVGGAQLGCNDDSNGTLQSSLSLNLSAGQALTIVVDGYGSACGSSKLNIASSSSPPSAPPTNALNLWLRADAGVTTSSGLVANWADQSSSGNNAYMTTPSRQPTFVSGALNGKPVIRFNGAQSLWLPSPVKPNSFTVFIAGKNSKPTESFSMILGPGGNNANNQLRWENGSQALFVGTGNNLPIITSSIGNTRVYHALSAWYDGYQMKVYRDGNLVSTHSFTTSTTWDLNQIGAYYSSYFMIGDVAEILFYTSALSETDRTTVNSYLKGKYALP
jgi:hypothetical protein